MGRRRLTANQKWQLRIAVIAGPTDCPLSPAEAAAFLGRSMSFLRGSDIPRANIGGPMYLKSELLKAIEVQMSHHVLEDLEE